MPRTKAIVGNRRAHERASIGETAVAIFHHGYSRRVAGVIRFCHRYSFYSFNAENSIHSIQKLMNGPTVMTVVLHQW